METTTLEREIYLAPAQTERAEGISYEGLDLKERSQLNRKLRYSGRTFTTN